MHTIAPSLRGYGLTTALIHYRIPDFKSILQTFIWQDYDTEPEFPKLNAFLHHWKTTLDGPLVSVKVVHGLLVVPDDFSKWLH